MFGLGILRGMAITFKHFVRTYVGGEQFGRGEALFTIQYPEEKPPLPPRFRGAVMLIFDPETGEPLCTACTVCARICPVKVITVEKIPKSRPPKVQTYIWESQACMFCGLCVEVCNFEALEMSHMVELGDYFREEKMDYDIDRMRELARKFYGHSYPPRDRYTFLKPLDQTKFPDPGAKKEVKAETPTEA